MEGLITLMDSNYTQPINIGNPEEHTIQGKVKVMLKLLFIIVPTVSDVYDLLHRIRRSNSGHGRTNK